MRADQAYDELMRRVREESAPHHGRGAARVGRGDLHAARRGREPERAARARGRAAARARHRPAARRAARGRRGLRAAGRSRRARRGQRARAPAGVRPVRPAAPEAGRGGGPHDRAGPEGLGRRPRRRGLRALPAVARADRRRSSGTRPSAWGTTGSATTRCWRTTSRGFGAPWRRRLFDALKRRAGAAARPHRRRAPPAGPVGAPPALPARPAAALRRDRGGRRRLRLRPRTHGPRRPSLLHRHRLGRLPDHRALRRPRLRRRPVHHPARGRPRAVRAGPGAGALRHAVRRDGVGRHGRVAGPVLGESGGAGPQLLGALLPPCARALPREPGRRAAGRVPLRGEPRGALAASGCRRTR